MELREFSEEEKSRISQEFDQIKSAMRQELELRESNTQILYSNSPEKAYSSVLQDRINKYSGSSALVENEEDLESSQNQISTHQLSRNASNEYLNEEF